ncbi:MAG TPA: YceI family protein [Candidatus Polarisedimenticolaceae bacterium]|nr:YceI family protein [Candidatus Polarisedimenticolaceae bacterium]
MIATLVLAALVAQAADYRIDPQQASAGFDLKATLHTVHGTTAKVSGQVKAIPEDGGGLVLSGRIEIAAGSLATGNTKRDATMHGESLDVAHFPLIVLEPERFAPSAPPADGGRVAGRILGRLTIRGTTQPVTIEATLAPAGGGIAADGTFDVRWADFGIPDPSFFVVHIEPVAHAHFQATFLPAP